MKKTLLLCIFATISLCGFAQVIVTSCGQQYCVSDDMTVEEVLEYYDIVEEYC